MEALKTNKTLRGQIEGMETQINDAQAEVASLTDQLAAANDSIVLKDQSIATLTAENGKLADEYSETSALLETAQADLIEANDKIEAAENSTTSKAKEIAAAAGHEPNVKPADEGEQGGESAHAKYVALKATNPAAATKFWNDNKDEIIAQR